MLDFGLAPVGTSKTLEVKVFNGTVSAVNITNIALTGTPTTATFSFDAGTTIPVVLAVGESLTIQVTFDSVVVFPGFLSATLTVTSDATDPTAILSIAGFNNGEATRAYNWKLLQ